MQENQQSVTVKLGLIRPGKNPRKYFDPAKMAEITESIREDGVIQPILVRPLEDGTFELVAGERRYRGAKAAHGDDYDMPVVIREMTEGEARRLALIENVQRADMAPSEEAVAAADIVGDLKGDRDEAARQLGWPRSTLDRRLALMNCSALVLDALNTRSIQLGHAELLATLTKEKQDLFLPIILQEKKTVADLKKAIEQAACNLKDAIFDKGECATCTHNSELQSEMFSEAIASGSCTNPTCYKGKTEKQLEGISYGLKDEYPVIRIVRAGDNHTRVQLQVEGPTGVGAEQAKACHGCQNFGAAVSGLPDSLGKIFRGQCFDPSCNAKKVAARIKSECTEAPPAGKGTKAAPAKSGAAKGGKVEQAATSIAESDKVKTYRQGVWRKALRREVAANEATANHYLLALSLSGHARTITSDKMGVLFERIVDETSSPTDLSKNLASVAGLPTDKRLNLTISLALAAIEGIDVPVLTSLCKYHALDLAKHWNLQKSKDFLELLTKSELKVLADELGMRNALGDRFSKLFNQSKPEVIEALLKVDGFDYTGKVPKVLKF
ncbi:chromosome partitioning protein ParB [Ralstonia solanacearum]|uniref:ParB-like partition protein n=2 Tax=Pseudomonadota TaxID=1224 RepID=A0A0S4U4S4_RALSL|nr:chromosome partitioning protein ParB [Ralstonia solanacearum]CUV17029.1 ParB-like partition protein [Ralstonia solanacearum]